ncbi:hypothetical protein TNCV_5075381 [Trichonephila clavipes]|uniref:Endonuclease-reverse transcriptase n=1 Tax=Trichonephila clavipes TaxID=2585209 RepID=A0A8X6S2Z2_TRICX|nr:hypothetical protein TNCV_5075381 [Trichonephila clavipes]
MLHKALLRSVVSYACETWSMFRTDEIMISIYQRKILRFIFGGIRENGTWQKRTNLELYQSYKESDIVNFIKIQLINWAGHVVRVDGNHTTNYAQPIGIRKKGRPNLRWIDDLEKDLLVLRTKNWRTLARRRLAWKSLFEKAEDYPGLSSH